MHKNKFFSPMQEVSAEFVKVYISCRIVLDQKNDLPKRFTFQNNRCLSSFLFHEIEEANYFVYLV